MKHTELKGYSRRTRTCVHAAVMRRRHNAKDAPIAPSPLLLLLLLLQKSYME